MYTKKRFKRKKKSRKQKGGEIEKELQQFLKENLHEMPTLEQLGRILHNYRGAKITSPGHEIIGFVISLFPPAKGLRLPPELEAEMAAARAARQEESAARAASRAEAQAKRAKEAEAVRASEEETSRIAAEDAATKEAYKNMTPEQRYELTNLGWGRDYGRDTRK